MTLYEIRNSVTGQGYVGITSRSLFKRWQEHKYELKTNKHGNVFLQNAYNKYGRNSFELIILGIFETLDTLNKAEKEVIKTNKHRLYNFASGGTGQQHTTKTKEEISRKQRKAVVGMSIETGEIREYESVMDTAKDGFFIKNIGKICKKSIYVPKNRKSFRTLSTNGWVWMYKSEFTLEEMKNRIKIAKYKTSQSRKLLAKSLKTGEILEFISSREAKDRGFNMQCVWQAAIGNRVKSHKGHVWAFADIPNCQSLLYQRYDDYVKNPPKTGPKCP